MFAAQLMLGIAMQYSFQIVSPKPECVCSTNDARKCTAELTADRTPWRTFQFKEHCRLNTTSGVRAKSGRLATINTFRCILCFLLFRFVQLKLHGFPSARLSRDFYKKKQQLVLQKQNCSKAICIIFVSWCFFVLGSTSWWLETEAKI
jgi:hypothetical protein